MRKINLVPLFVLLFLSVTFSCSQNDSIVNSQIPAEANHSSKRVAEKSGLKSDPRFIELLRQVVEVPEIRNMEKVRYFAENDIKSEPELNEATLALGYSTSDDFKNKAVEIDYLIKYLDEDYGIRSIDKKDLKIIIEETYENEGIITVYGGDPCECNRKLRNDLISNAATALLAHTGCGLADTTVVIGLICHGAVYTIHMTADDNARIERNACVRECV